MQIIEMKIEDLIPYENNPRKNDEAVDAVAESIRQFGFKVPIIVDRNKVIVAGHTRLRAAEKLGMRTVPVIMAADLSDDQVTAFRLADNKTAELAAWDFSALEAELEKISDIDMTVFGFDVEKELESLSVEEDDPPEEVKTRCAVGEVWKLGEHRLICGDSTDPVVVDRLMDGCKADMLFTSPPYSDLREYNGNKDLSVSNLAQFISVYKPYTDYQCVNLGIQRKEHEIVQYWDEYISKAKACGYKFLAWNVWDKTMAGSIGQQSAFFPIRHEWIFVFGTEFFEINGTWEKKPDSIGRKENLRKVRQPDGTTKYSTIGDTSNKLKQMESVVQICSECGKIRELHPATFPVQLPAEYIKAMTDIGGSVIEPFGGSGSTLIACEQLNRKCYIAELDPTYCDVIIQRWENLTGKTAVKLA